MIFHQFFKLTVFACSVRSERKMESLPRHDLFKFLRQTMWIASMYPWSIPKYFPAPLKFLVMLIDLLVELFSYFVSAHLAVLYACSLFIYFDTGSLEYIVDCLIQLIIYLWTCAMKIYFRRLRLKKLDEIMDSVNENYAMHSAYGLTYVTMNGGIALSEKYTKLFVYCCYVGTLFWLILPIAYRDYSLPLACWYPFDYKQPFIYETMYFLQSMGQLQVAIAFSASAGMYLKLTVLCCGQYDVLFCNLKNMVVTANLHMGTNIRELNDLRKLQDVANDEADQYYCAIERSLHNNQLIEYSKKFPYRPSSFSQAFGEEFRKCINFHRFLLGTLLKIEHFYSFILLLKSGEMTILLCLVAFVSVKSSNASIMKFVTLAQYLLLVLWDLSIFCYFGEMVKRYSQRCDEAILRSPWYLHMQEIKKDLLLFLTNTQKSFCLTAGKMYILDLLRFRSVVGTAFSFLTLLQKMDKRRIEK